MVHKIMFTVNRIQNLRWLLLLCGISLFVSSCREEPTKNKSNTKLSFEEFDAPLLNEDSIYQYIEDQLSFGHRVPGFEEHKACKDYLVNHLKRQGANVQVQEFTSNFLSVENAPSFNIIASFNPSASKRILLAAHWDSRLIAEKDEEVNMKNKPIMGADDGASGTAVLLELARVLNARSTSYLGVDIMLFDAEDQGTDGGGWCQGSKFWASSPHDPNYFAEYGILLDMVGAEGAQFGYEAYSEQYGLKYLDKVWGLAEFLGYGDLFVKTKTGPIMDDHYYVMTRGIPMIDIINRPMKTESGFGHYHHTHKDDISIISKENLRKVGHVISQVIYREESGKF